MSAATPVRKDPKPRVFNGEIRGTKLLNKDPTKHYVFVNPADQDSFGYYEAMGYVPEEASETGVRLAASAGQQRKGEKITYQGQILMSVALERRQEIEKYGPEGDCGSEWANAMEARIVDKGRMERDLMRGFDSRYTRSSAEVGTLQRGV